MSGSTDTKQIPALADLSVIRAMHPGVLACAPETSVQRIAELMVTYGIHAIIVFRRDRDGGPMPWGVVSDLDLVGAVLADENATAGSIAASPVVTVETDRSLERAAQLMVEHDAPHLIVLDADTSHPVGILSTLDVAAAVSGTQVRSGPPRRRRARV
jgi:CBS domain-containing protein